MQPPYAFKLKLSALKTHPCWLIMHSCYINIFFGDFKLNFGLLPEEEKLLTWLMEMEKSKRHAEKKEELNARLRDRQCRLWKFYFCSHLGYIKFYKTLQVKTIKIFTTIARQLATIRVCECGCEFEGFFLKILALTNSANNAFLCDFASIRKG